MTCKPLLIEIRILRNDSSAEGHSPDRTKPYLLFLRTSKLFDSSSICFQVKLEFKDALLKRLDTLNGLL